MVMGYNTTYCAWHQLDIPFITHSSSYIPCIHICSCIDQEIYHLSPPMTRCQVERGVAILILISEGRGILVNQIANDTIVLGEKEIQ